MRDADPCQASSALIDLRVVRTDRAMPPAAAALEVPTAGVPTYLFAGALAQRLLRRFRILLDRIGLRTRHEFLLLLCRLCPV